MNDRLPSLTYIISSSSLFCVPVVSIPLCRPWNCTCPLPFLPFSWSHLSLCVSLCQSLSRFRSSLHHHLSIPHLPPSLPHSPPGTDSGEPIHSRSCLLFATVNSASWENGLFSSLRAFSFGQLGSLPWNYFRVVVRRLICPRQCDTSIQWQWLHLSDYDNDIRHDATFGAHLISFTPTPWEKTLATLFNCSSLLSVNIRGVMGGVKVVPAWVRQGWGDALLSTTHWLEI